jgi:hypothetical protein
VRVSTTVLADVGGWRSTIRIVPAEVDATFHRASGETGSPSRWSFPVPLHLDGHPLRAATVSCSSADGLSVTGGFGMGGLPENLMLAGDHDVNVITTEAMTTGEHAFDCTLTALSPASLEREITGARITVRVH